MKGRQTFRLSLVTPHNKFERPVGAVKNAKLAPILEKLAAQALERLQDSRANLADANKKDTP